MRGLFDKILKQMEENKDTVAALLLKDENTEKSIIGTHMLFSDAGRIYGSFDNGMVRRGIETYAIHLFEGDKEGVRHFTYMLNGNTQLIESAFCFAYISAVDLRQRRMAERASELLQAGEKMWLAVNTESMELSVIDTFGVACGAEVPDEVCRCFPEISMDKIAGGVRYYIEAVEHAHKVYIFGGSDISLALTEVLRPTAFCCVVLDENMEYANRERFPDIYDVRTIDYYRMERLYIEEGDMAVVLTRDFQYDEMVEAYLLSTPVNMIIDVGNPSKRQYEERWLMSRGYGIEQLSRMKTVEVGDGTGWTSYEVAVRIAAMLIQGRLRKKGERNGRYQPQNVTGT